MPGFCLAQQLASAAISTGSSTVMPASGSAAPAEIHALFIVARAVARAGHIGDNARTLADFRGRIPEGYPRHR